MDANDADSSDERELTPAIRRRQDADRGGKSESPGESSSGNVAGGLDREQPLEPGDIDLENAFFVLVGALGVIAFLVFGIQGL